MVATTHTKRGTSNIFSANVGGRGRRSHRKVSNYFWIMQEFIRIICNKLSHKPLLNVYNQLN